MFTYPLTQKEWNNNSLTYNDVWSSCFKKWQSQRETYFIEKYYLKQKQTKSTINILDIGVGTGRILRLFLDNEEKNIFGIDYAFNMIRNLKKKYKNRVVLKLCDISKQSIPYKNKFDFITVIRVFKYIPNWRYTLNNIINVLNQNGVLVITFTNKNSVSAFSGDKVLMLSLNTVRKELNKNGLKIIDTGGFSRLPEMLYRFQLLCFLFISIERVLNIIFPKHLFSKELFIVAQKIE